MKPDRAVMATDTEGGVLAAGGAHRRATVCSRSRQRRRDETNLSPQWGFHAITNVLETGLTRFIPVKRFPSLSSQFHAES